MAHVTNKEGPLSSTDQMKTHSLRARIPRPIMRALDELARRYGTTRSSIVRELLRSGLQERGVWPPGGSDVR